MSSAGRKRGKIMARSKFATFALSTAIASLAISGCTANVAPPAAASANKAAAALSKGKEGRAIEHAEAAVLASPHDASYRAVLGASYMEAGRFQSAASAFGDALALGDTSARTALSYALAQIAAGDSPAAMAVLDEHAARIDPADLGLAFALAGQPRHGVEVLERAIRGGQNTAKTRQNLAYSYALSGDWRSARLMAEQDVPPNLINHRIAEWAETATPGLHQQRVASLLQVPIAADSGMPAQLALNNIATPQQLAVEAASQVPAPVAASGELPPINAPAGFAAAEAPIAPVPQAPVAPQQEPQTPVAPQQEVAAVAPSQQEVADSFARAFEQAPAAPPAGANFAEVAQSTIAFVSEPVVQNPPKASRPAAASSATPRSRVAAPRVSGERAAQSAPARATGGSHLVQLGSFSSRARAERAWDIYKARYSDLKDSQMVITEARVRGKTYFRVSASGYNARSASSMCSSVKSGGRGCIAWAEGRPLPGAIDRNVRLARRDD